LHKRDAVTKLLPQTFEHLRIFKDYSEEPDYLSLESQRWELVAVYESSRPGINPPGSQFDGRVFVFKRVKV
jgi:hypothetical protein